MKARMANKMAATPRMAISHQLRARSAINGDGLPNMARPSSRGFPGPGTVTPGRRPPHGAPRGQAVSAYQSPGGAAAGPGPPWPAEPGVAVPRRALRGPARYVPLERLDPTGARRGRGGDAGAYHVAGGPRRWGAGRRARGLPRTP